MNKLEEHASQIESLAVQVNGLSNHTEGELLHTLFTSYISDISKLVAICENNHNRVPLEKVKQMIPKIQMLDKQKSELESLIQIIQQQPQNPFDSSVFFNGCNSSEKLDKRYKTLCKVYHPDGQGGDEETFKKMKSEYETLKNQFC